MAFQQACTRCALVFLILSLQAALLRAEEAQLKAAPELSASPSSSAPSPQARSAQPETSGLRSQALLASIDKILKRAATEREEAKTLPSRDKFLFDPVWTATREEREKEVRELLDGALSVVTDAPILKLQEDIHKQQDKIAANRDRIATLREKRLGVPQPGLLPSIFTETTESIDKTIAALEEDIKRQEAGIVRIKQEIGTALAAAGVTLSQDQLDLLLDGVLGGDLLKLMAAFEVAKIADERLATLVQQSDEDLKSARRYFAMHAALFAMLVQAQDMLIERIDKTYLARLREITSSIDQTGAKTRELLRSAGREDQRKALDANLKAQDVSRRVSVFYRDYLQAQRRLLAQARDRSVFDLRVADNTYETVEESFQLKALMDEARASFESVQKLDHPGFEQIFRNENLRREFENLTQKLGPSS
ncbi:MAG TPA: hypothetical protein VNR65_16390 [Geobacterales bacterium]|nr:hypothetical protein [Geobacterales bacterium]